ncbi:hypothetical protein SISNIDRAFT_493792, partial [Sistotremastrum niveocremeum HHB9708]
MAPVSPDSERRPMIRVNSVRHSYSGTPRHFKEGADERPMSPSSDVSTFSYLLAQFPMSRRSPFRTSGFSARAESDILGQLEDLTPDPTEEALIDTSPLPTPLRPHSLSGSARSALLLPLAPESPMLSPWLEMTTLKDLNKPSDPIHALKSVQNETQYIIPNFLGVGDCLIYPNMKRSATSPARMMNARHPPSRTRRWSSPVSANFANLGHSRKPSSSDIVSSEKELKSDPPREETETIVPRIRLRRHRTFENLPDAANEKRSRRASFTSESMELDEEFRRLSLDVKRVRRKNTLQSAPPRWSRDGHKMVAIPQSPAVPDVARSTSPSRSHPMVPMQFIVFMLVLFVPWWAQLGTWAGRWDTVTLIQHSPIVATGPKRTPTRRFPSLLASYMAMRSALSSSM